MKAHTFVLLALLASSVACRSTPRQQSLLESVADPFEHPEIVYRFSEGGRSTYTEDGLEVLSFEVRNGMLLCNDVDTGPYAPGTPVRILSSREFQAGRERRPIPRP